MATDELTLPISNSPPDHSQWRLETLQIINWGGFHGHHVIGVAPGSTLIAGASGVGKSTLLDAWIALMMPSDVPFNGASNAAGTGRARSAEQRNLLTYLRGKQDKKADGAGTRELVLRGMDGGPVWGAIACTFVNDNARKYTVTRLYFVRSGAANTSVVTTTFAASQGYLDLARLKPLASSRFDKGVLKGNLPGLVSFDTFREFEENLHTRLGIGGGDGGRKAMQLLSRVQAGMQVNRVDDLYKAMVLEEPVTYQTADDALAHFANLKASYRKKVDEAEKVRALHRLPALQHDMATAQAQADLIGQFGVDRDGPTPFLLWRLQTERALLDAAVAENRRDEVETTASFTQGQVTEGHYEERLVQIADEKHSNGGRVIDERLHEITRLNNSKDGVYRANLNFQTRTEAINLVEPETAELFATAQVTAADFLAGFAKRREALTAEEETALEAKSPLAAAQRELLAEKTSLNGRTGMVPRRLHEARVRIAQAADLDPMNDLPFVAELMDVLPDEEHWRRAIETTLGGVSRIILVDRHVRDRLSAAIDGVTIRPRVQFQAVTLAEHEDWQGEPDYVSGKLTFKDSSFSRWVQDRVSQPGVDHLCVGNATALTGTEPRVTPSGQTRNGDKGAHGESGDGYIIGFSNERRIADIDRLLDELEPQIKAAQVKVDDVRQRMTDLRAQRDAHLHVQEIDWTSIDFRGLGRRVVELEEEIQRLRAANKVVDALQAEEEQIKPLLEEARRTRILTQNRLEKLGTNHTNLCEEQDTVQDATDEIVNKQTAVVTENQRVYLDKLLTEYVNATILEYFASTMRGMEKKLREEAAFSQRTIRSTKQTMETLFESYKRRWTEHNLGTSFESADGYREILDRIQTEGLYERREKWRREVAAWSSDDLLQLNDAFDTALEDIEERLGPVNRILAMLPFGGKGVLQIDMRRLPSEKLTQFRRSLRELSSGLALELTEQQIETRFRKLTEFMAKISIPEGHTKSSTAERDRYLDVRQHVVITALCLDEHGREVARYDHIADKSGGEMQELVAFVVGSALRYQLGDETRSQPRFAPVFLLDEAFIKADSEFAGRAIRAWQNLGFQLIVGAPLDKVTSLEPHMDLLMTVSKNHRGYSFVTELPDDDGAET